MSRTHFGYRALSKEPGGGHGSVTELIAQHKVHFFKTLFNAIRNKVGNYEKARELIGLSDYSMDQLEKGRLNTTNAKKILDCYNKIKLAD